MVVTGREKEYLKLKEHVDIFRRTREGNIVYISGVPGSGKTYTVVRLLDSQEMPYVLLNTTMLRRRREVYERILAGLSCGHETRGSSVLGLRSHLSECRMCHVVVIDEVDLLVGRRQEVLYNLFDMAYLEDSRLLLFLISNTMDLPERLFEPKVCSRIGRKRVNFVPYTAAQLQSIVSDARVDGKSIELASKRVGSVSGDARRMIDIVNRAKEEKRRGIIGISDIDAAMKKMYTPPHVYYLQGLTFYQKIILGVVGGASKSRMSIRTVYEDFTAFCRRADVNMVDFCVFKDLVELLVDYGILKYVNCRRDVSLMILTEEVEKSLSNDEDYGEIVKRMGMARTE